MMILGVVLFLIGSMLKFPYHHGVLVLGAILFLIGLVMFILGTTSRNPGGRRHWY